MLKIQKWLLDNDHDFEKLEENFGIKSKIYEDRVVLNYSQIAGDKYNPMSKECRALILHYPNTSKVMSRSFDRFYNYNEDQKTKEYDISKAIIYEKVDGDLINIYSDDSTRLFISTRSMAFAEGETVHGPTYKDLVLRTRPYLLQTLQKFFSKDFLESHTFIFELCTAENRVVKQYGVDKLFLLGIRNKEVGFFLHDWDVDKIADQIGVDRPEEIYLNSYDTVIENISKLPATDEGYVCNWDNWRIKIKNPAYLAIAHLKENGVISPKRIAKLIFLEDEQEYLEYFPEDNKFFTPYLKAYHKFRKHIDDTWQVVKDIENQKEFAMEVKDLKIGFIMFGIKKGLKYEDIVKKMTDNKMLEILEYYKD